MAPWATAPESKAGASCPRQRTFFRAPACSRTRRPKRTVRIGCRGTRSIELRETSSRVSMFEAKGPKRFRQAVPSWPSSAAVRSMSR